MIDVWSRKVVECNVAERKEAQMAAKLVGRACLRERISKGLPEQLILHAERGNTTHAVMLRTS